ncbi:hypothetical protein Y032_0267g752 [Ancylostoma ceylanicum]|uniref:Uncharacterized protein n=1 Tax=Ancylostoma ceylanicum TaxID=53326 RepID=A0A016SA61_9BILA|nr:hypothetical protein Y032_0267g752 [Ancylostoma ceylanicum]
MDPQRRRLVRDRGVADASAPSRQVERGGRALKSDSFMMLGQPCGEGLHPLKGDEYLQFVTRVDLKGFEYLMSKKRHKATVSLETLEAIHTPC